MGDNKNVHRTISDQIDMGLRFFEIDVYKSRDNWCVFHGGEGFSFLDGNSFYFSDILDEIASGLERIGNEVIFIKMDGFNSSENPEEFFEREKFLTSELERLNLAEAVYIRQPDETQPPSLNELAEHGKRLIIVSGTRKYPWGWRNAGTSAKHYDRADPLRQKIENPNGHEFIRWNAFALQDLKGWGSTQDADYLHARLVGHGIEKWAQGAHRISHLIVDFPSRQSVGMSAMRAASIFNQIPSAYGTIKDSKGKVLTDVSYRFWIENANVADDQHWLRWDGYHDQTITAEHAHGKFDFPRPHGIAISITPFKEGYRFEPQSIYLQGEEEHEPVKVEFKAIKK